MARTSASKTPRVVLVTRRSGYDMLVARHGTHGQARFFLESRGQSIEPVVKAHQCQLEAKAAVNAAIPVSWRRGAVDRTSLDRFLFEPDDIVVAVGQDGLVANAAKYLGGLLVIGINPDPTMYDGVLVKHPPQIIGDLLAIAASGTYEVERRTMVEARVDGMRLTALNEVFVGHRTHQSARYHLQLGDEGERHSSSGLIVATGTGSTGWARSIHEQCGEPLLLPTPEEYELAFFVREAFPSVSTGNMMTYGIIPADDAIVVRSEMNDGGVIFGDGIEDDRMNFDWGREVRIGRAPEELELLVG